ARSPPSLKLGISNEDATCRLGFHDTPERSNPSPVRIGRNGCSTTRNACTPSAETAVRFRTFWAYDVGRFACTTPAETPVRFRRFYTANRGRSPSITSVRRRDTWRATRFWRRQRPSDLPTLEAILLGSTNDGPSLSSVDSLAQYRDHQHRR